MIVSVERILAEYERIKDNGMGIVQQSLYLAELLGVNNQRIISVVFNGGEHEEGA